MISNKNKIFKTEYPINKIKNIKNKEKLNEENNKNDKENKDNKENIINNKKSDVTILKKNRRNTNYNISNKKKNNIKKQKIIDIKKGKSINIIEINTKRNSFEDNNLLDSKNKLTNKLPILDQEVNNDMKKKLDRNNTEIIEKRKVIKEKEILSDYELNDLEYLEALKLDNRNFLKIYWYLLKREHLILFTFFNWNDFNIFSIKLAKFFLSICSDMAFNVFFFSDESMHNVYVSGGEHDFIGQLAQMIYSTIISQILQIFINYLTMTDISYYQIKELKKDNNINKTKTLSIMKCIKNKIIVFYSFTFILFLFFWYLISAFCSVYKNTQRIFITDSITSFIMGLLYPFIIYLIPTGLRIISLQSKKDKNLKILYSLSDKIPFF